MKFSKESHRKTGVGITENDGAIGLLYRDPMKEEESIEEVVESRVDETTSLFNIFTVSQDIKKIIKQKDVESASIEDKEKAILMEEAKNVADLVIVVVRTLKSNNNLQTDLFVEKIKKQKKTEVKYTERGIDEALNRFLKKSFRVLPTKNALRELLIYTLIKNQSLSQEQKEKIQKNFIDKLVSEYNKTTVKQNVPKALRNQNMVIQPNPNKEGKILAISETPKSKETKTSEKDAFRDFLSEYAVLDENKRHELRVKLRRLVVLYFYGPDRVVFCDFDEWKDHESKKSEDVFFADIIKDRKVTKNADEKETVNVDATFDSIRTKNISSYRESLSFVNSHKEGFFDNQVLNKFWIHHIENEVERIYKHIKPSTPDYKFQIGYLSEKVWKGIINYLSIKYIAEGKAVYNYAMTALSNENNSKAFGKIDENYIKGISSFEYERIKAGETLQRECAVNIAFAARHLANATVNLDDVNTDFLLLKLDEPSEKEKQRGIKSLVDCAKPNVRKNLLQFFGGESIWKDFDFRDIEDIKLLDEFKKMIYSLRNASFHYKTENIDTGSRDTELIAEMFKKDCQNASGIQKNKMFSNNVVKFYREEDIQRLLEKLYSKINNRASQVPSFNAVFVRKNFKEYLAKHTNAYDLISDDLKNIWESAVYYLYKEIYYNLFLQDSNSFQYLKDYVDGLDEDKNCTDKKMLRAHIDFKNAFKEYAQMGNLSSVCQMIMTEYNNQNQGHRKAISGRSGMGKELKYKHYKIILLNGLRSAFSKYLKENEKDYGFINKPTVNILNLEDFLPTYTSNQYNDLVECVRSDFELQKWYVVGRLLNPKQVNQLIGSFRSYTQYVNDVKRRAELTGNPIRNMDVSVDVENIVGVLDVCTKLNGMTSNVLEDYFENENEYARYVANFVNFGQTKGCNYAKKLKEFCNQEINGQKIGIYHDGTNPIINRNVILCKLYGATEIISKSEVKKVDLSTIREYFKLANKIKQYKVSGVCRDKVEQLNVRDYQEIKNRVELRNIVEYSEIINELQGQLINWGYLRERDLMYFQLGFHYLSLHNNEEKPNGYDNAGDEYTGAILYQIVAMYTNGIDLIDVNGKSKGKENLPTGAKVNLFGSYSKEMLGLAKKEKDPIYIAGLELFEYVKEHNQCVDLRNYIEHFHYYAKHNRSMLDIYSEVFDRFFTYDMKYAKNVPNMMYNILLQHLVVAMFDFTSGEKKYGDSYDLLKKRASISIRKPNGLASEKFIYNLENGKKVIKLTARGRAYLEDIATIIYYPDDVPEEIIKDPIEDDKDAKGKDKKVKIQNDGKKRTFNNHNKKNNHGYRSKQPPKKKDYYSKRNH